MFFKMIMKRRPLIYFLLAVIGGVFIEISASAVRGFLGFQWSALLGSIIIVVLSYYTASFIRKKSGTAGIVWGIPLGLILLVMPLVIFDTTETILSFPDLCTHVLSAIVGVGFAGMKRVMKITVVSLYVTVLAAVYFSYPSYIEYQTFGRDGAEHKDTLDLERLEPLSPKTNMPNLAKSDLLVLDFWNTRCGVCFKKLPLFASIRDRWNSKYPVSFSLVNVPYLNEDDVEIVERIRTFDTTFTLQIMRDPIYAQQIGIEGFPTVIAVRPSGEIVYFGSVDQLESFLEDFYH
ncbi:MAG: hypothetical protein LW750_03085 [Bacteroidetes bacterium]|nr:hypothetical protein [Bacteroidota bacterium]